MVKRLDPLMYLAQLLIYTLSWQRRVLKPAPSKTGEFSGIEIEANLKNANSKQISLGWSKSRSFLHQTDK